MANEKIRIGNDIDIRWSLVDGDGNPYNMEGKDISIEIVVNDSKRVRIKQFTVSGNTLHFIYYGKDQKYLGSCDLKYIENDGKVEMVTFDTQAAFTMVPHSWLAVDADEQPERVYLEYTTVVSQLVDIGHGHIDIDDHLDLESENPVQNKVITAAILTLEISEIPEAGATPEELDEIGLTREVLIDLCDGKYKWVKVGGENYAVVNSVPIDETAGLDGNVIFADTQIFVPADDVYLPFVQKLVIDPESTSNKVTSLSASSTDVQYPSAKAVHNAVAGMLKYTSQSLTEAQKEQAKQNINADDVLISSVSTPPADFTELSYEAAMTAFGVDDLHFQMLLGGYYTDIMFGYPAIGYINTVYQVHRERGSQTVTFDAGSFTRTLTVSGIKYTLTTNVDGAVRFDLAQTLFDIQKEQARNNIEAAKNRTLMSTLNTPPEDFTDLGFAATAAALGISPTDDIFGAFVYGLYTEIIFGQGDIALANRTYQIHRENSNDGTPYIITFDTGSTTRTLTVNRSTRKCTLTTNAAQDISGKADKVSGATSGNFAGLDANGNLVDSGKKASDFATAAQGTKADGAVRFDDSQSLTSEQKEQARTNMGATAPEVFWATYGTTTRTQIQVAVSDGKVVLCFYETTIYYLSTGLERGLRLPPQPYVFYSGDGQKMLVLSTSREWSSSTVTYENAANKVTSFGSTPSDTKYPSEKLVKDSLDLKADVSGVSDVLRYSAQTLTDAQKAQALSNVGAASQAVIPSEASSSNQLADKAFVNSSISTATATYRGSYNLVSDLSLTVSATQSQVATALGTAISTADNNDYAFVQIPTSDATPAEIARVERYKYNGSAWAFEYALNNSGFTAAQWAALNSGITSGLVSKLSDLPTNSELTNLLAGKQPTIDSSNKLPYSLISGTPTIPDAVEANPTVPSGTTPTDLAGLKVGNSYYGIPQLPTVDNTPTANSDNLVKSGGVYSEIHPAVQSTQPAGGFQPNVMYALGEITGTVTFALAAAVSGIVNHYYWTFETGSTAPTITWPNGITWLGGSAPEISASKHYEISVLNGIGCFMEV